jgi:hypothetical protein
MDYRFLKLPLFVALLLLTSGCELWTVGGSTYQAPKQAFAMNVPSGWSYSTRMGADLIATRDGLAMQSIQVRSVPLAKALPHSQRELSASLAAFELAETIKDDMQSNQALQTFTVIANEPATIGGQSGYKLTVTYSTSSQLRLTETQYGTIRNGELWTLTFQAPSRHYHERDLPAFESAVAGFKFGPTKP